MKRTAIEKNSPQKMFYFPSDENESRKILNLLAYDIVTKIHGGTMAVTSDEGNGSTFIITIPL